VETNQLVFLLYLFLGQVVLLGLWSLRRRRAEAPAPGRFARFGFAVYWLSGQVALFVGWTYLVEAWDATDVVTAADLVVTLHFGFVVFVIGLELFVLAGWPLGWAWTRNFWLRLLHLVCIEIVVGQAVVGLECPLTSVERDLRGSVRGDQPGDDDLSWRDFYRAQLHHLEGSTPVARFCHHKLFYPIPEATYPYVVAPFGLLLLLTWVFVPPRMPGQAAVTNSV
jgi:hypothetical protein